MLGNGKQTHMYVHIYTHTHTLQDLSNHLLHACVHGSPAALQTVLNEPHNLNLDAPLKCSNKQELTPLSLASLAPSSQTCELLIKSGVGVNSVDNLGRSALHWAVLGRHVTSVRSLVKQGADVEMKDNKVVCVCDV